MSGDAATSAGSGGAGGPRRTTLLALCLIAALLSARPAAAQDAPPGPVFANLLLIDHSGSMRAPADDGKGGTRWSRVLDQARETVRNADEGTLLWVAIFGGRGVGDTRITERLIGGDDDRQRLLAWLDALGPPDGQTPLYDSLAQAFERAGQLARQNPNTTVFVTLYSDGRDEGSRRTRDQLQRALGDLAGGTPRVYPFFVSLVDDAPPLDGLTLGRPGQAIAVRLDPPRVTLASPLEAGARQEVVLAVATDAKYRPLIDGKAVGATFTGGPPGFRATAGDATIRGDELRVTLDVADPAKLDPAATYAGTLNLRWPAVPGYAVIAPDAVPVEFAKQTLELRDVRPADGSVFAARTPVRFAVAVPPGVRVEWDFGGGDTAAGAEAVRSFPTAGRREVNVAASTDAGARVGRTVGLDVIDVAASVDDPGVVVAGEPATFTLTARGEGIERFEWVVDGATYQGGGDRGETLAHTFDTPGEHALSARAIHPRVVVDAPPRTVNVVARPTLTIAEPAGRLFAFPDDGRLTVEFVARATGDVPRVRWTVAPLGADGEPTGGSATTEAAVVEGVSRLSQVFLESAGYGRVRVTAEAVGGPAPAEPQSVELRLTRDVAVKVARPESMELPFDEPITFAAEVAGPGVRAVRWEVLVDDAPAAAMTVERPVGADFSLAFDSAALGGADRRVRVRATAVGAGGAAAMASDERAYAVRFSRPEPRVVVDADGGGPRWNRPVRLRLAPAGPYESVAWVIDGRRVKAPADADGLVRGGLVEHRFTTVGPHTVRADVVGRGGKRPEQPPSADVYVPLVDPAVTLDVRYRGELPTRVTLGRTVGVTLATTGDVAEARLTLDGRPLDAAATGVVMESLGKATLAAEVVGPAPADGGPPPVARAEYAFVVEPARPLWVPVGVTVAALLASAASAWALGRNGPRRWTVEGAGAGGGGGVPRRLGRYWSRLRKRAVVPLAPLFPSAEHYKVPPGRDDRLYVAARRARGDRPVGTLRHSRASRLGVGDVVVLPAPDLDEARQTAIRVQDRRLADADDPLRDTTLTLRMAGGAASGGGDLLLLALLLLAAIASVCYVWIRHFNPGA